MKRVVVAALSVAAALAAGVHCGGTTGQDAPTLPAAMTADGGRDATVAEAVDDASADQSLYTNTFDVVIDFADQQLPDVQAPPEGGSTGGPGGPPNCPPFILVDKDGGPVPLGGQKMAKNAVPSEYASDGGIGFAPDGSACAAYPWLGSVATDQCVIFTIPNPAQVSYVLLPPCNWAVGAGTAVKGAGAGAQRYDLCMEMYNCFITTQCYLAQNNYAYNCLCGIPDTDPNFANDCSTAPQGACLSQILAAMEENNDPRGINDAVTGWQDTSNMGPGFEGRFLEDLFENIQASCAPIACAATDAGVTKKDAGGVCSP